MPASIHINRQALEQARQLLEDAGFEVQAPPPTMLERGVILAAYRDSDNEGYLLGDSEIRLLAYHGMSAIDPDHPDPRPRWERDSTRDREAAYVEAALAHAVAEIATAAAGNRNNALNRAAFSLAGLEWLGLDRERAVHELVQAAITAGLASSEAAMTAQAAWRRGSEKPRDLPRSSGLKWARSRKPITPGW